MRPKHLRAAESGVGKHTARESERVQACAAGKERVTNAHPHKLAPEAEKLPGPFLFSGFDTQGPLPRREYRTGREPLIFAHEEIVDRLDRVRASPNRRGANLRVA